MTKTMKLGVAINAEPRKFSDFFLCFLGIHTYKGIYTNYENGSFEGYYDVCVCGHARKRDGTKPMLFRSTTSSFSKCHNPNCRMWHMESRFKHLLIVCLMIAILVIGKALLEQ